MGIEATCTLSIDQSEGSWALGVVAKILTKAAKDSLFKCRKVNSMLDDIGRKSQLKGVEGERVGSSMVSRQDCHHGNGH